MIENKFISFQEMGVIPPTLTHLAHADNLIPLCATCHECFDGDRPYWAMLPTEDIIDLFIDHERNDYIRREAAARRGLQQQRSLPVIIDEVLYVPYFLHESIAEGLQPGNWPKAWGGAPAMAILKAAVASNTPCPSQTIRTPLGVDVRLGIPGEIRTKVTELVVLWSRPDPEPVRLRRSRRRGGNNPDDERGPAGDTQRKGRTGRKQDPRGAGHLRRSKRVAGRTAGPGGSHAGPVDLSHTPHGGSMPLQKRVGA